MWTDGVKVNATELIAIYAQEYIRCNVKPAAVKKNEGIWGEVLDNLSANEMFLYFLENTKSSARWLGVLYIH